MVLWGLWVLWGPYEALEVTRWFCGVSGSYRVPMRVWGSLDGSVGSGSPIGSL